MTQYVNIGTMMNAQGPPMIHQTQKKTSLPASFIHHKSARHVKWVYLCVIMTQNLFHFTGPGYGPGPDREREHLAACINPITGVTIITTRR
jgi:hypothetical protein